MNLIEFFRRLKIAFAIIAGFLLGKWAASYFGHHASEFFVGGFGVGVVAAQGAFWALERLCRPHPAQSER